VLIGSSFVSISRTPDKAFPYFVENPPLEKYIPFTTLVFRLENSPPYADSYVYG